MFGVDDAALAILAAGIASSAGSLYANHQNLKQNKFVNDVNWAIAQANNEQQINLANTAHQREVMDLRAAGLNPILSAGGNGAAVPNLTSVRGEAGHVENPVNGIASSAKDFARYLSDQYKADLDNTKVSNDILSNQRDISSLDAEQARIAENALQDLTTEKRQVYDRRTGRYRWDLTLDSPNSAYYKAVKEGLLEEAKVRSHAMLWQGIQSGSQVLNSASALKNAFTPRRK